MKKITRVCFACSPYNLFLYLLISKSKEIEETFFYFSNLPKVICVNFSNYYMEKDISSNFLKLCYFSLLRCFRYLFWPFLYNVKYYGVDHVYMTFAILGSHKINVIEDGVATYCIEKKINRMSLWKSIFLGPLSCKNSFGHHDQADSIILTGILPYKPTNGIERVYVNARKLWNDSSIEKKRIILKCFNLTEHDILFLKSRTKILFTQPLSEDGYISEEEKVQLYKKLLGGIDYKDLIIRPHPRDRTDYQKYFQGCVFFKKVLPFEIISFLGIYFKVAYTIFSTVVYSLPSDTLVVWGGTEMHPNLVQKFGVICYDGL